MEVLIIALIIAFFVPAFLYSMYRLGFIAIDHKDDCPYMGSSAETEALFLDWVWRRRKEFIPIREWDGKFYLPTPYVLGGYMCIRLTKYGVSLSISPSLERNDLSCCIDRVSYGCNRSYNSYSSKKQWLKLVEWFRTKHNIELK